MLSRSSFNAMLKTLEEPPEHVKFLFATTDPKKLPITVLSRCLQFNLKNMTPEQIVHYLGVVLGKESIASDESALWQLGHAADGSMRDALSLTDQAISFGNGEVREEPVRSMLGSIDQREVYDLLDAIVREDGAAMLSKVAELSEYAPDYAGLLDDMMSVLHRVAIAHAAPDAVDNAQGDRELILESASKMPAELVQLLYQIGLIGQRDLSLAPTARMGFEMVLLRMMSFTPDEVQAGSQGSTGGNSEKKPEPQPAEPELTSAPSTAAVNAAPVNAAPVNEEPVNAAPAQEAAPDRSRIADLMSAINGEEQAPAPAAQKEAVIDEPAPAAEEKPAPAARKEAEGKPAAAKQEPATENKTEVAVTEPEVPEEPVSAESVPTTPSLEIGNWSEILSAMSLDGMTRNLAANCLLDRVENDHAKLKLAEHHASLWNQAHEGRIAQGLSELFGKEIKVSIEVGATDIETPAQIKEREQEESRAQAVADIESDHHVQQLIENFNGKLDPGSIRPLGS